MIESTSCGNRFKSITLFLVNSLSLPTPEFHLDSRRSWNLRLLRNGNGWTSDASICSFFPSIFPATFPITIPYLLRPLLCNLLQLKCWSCCVKRSTECFECALLWWLPGVNVLTLTVKKMASTDAGQTHKILNTILFCTEQNKKLPSSFLYPFFGVLLGLDSMHNT
jgi:hypothetical protein